MDSAAFLRSSAARSACFCSSDFPHAALSIAAAITAHISRLIMGPSPANRQSIFSQIRTTKQNTTRGIDADRLIAANLPAAIVKHVTFGFERLAHACADAAFHGEAIAHVADAWRIAGLL